MTPQGPRLRVFTMNGRTTFLFDRMPLLPPVSDGYEDWVAAREALRVEGITTLRFAYEVELDVTDPGSGPIT